MKVQATGYGRRGALDESCGKLVLTAQDEVEAKKLKVLADEIMDGNFTFWAQLIWGIREKKLHWKRIKSLDTMVSIVAKAFRKYLT